VGLILGPRSGGKYAILEGRALPLASPYIAKTDIVPFAAKQTGGDPKYGDFTLSSHQVYRDLRGGLGVQYVRPDKPNRFWESSLDTRFPYQVTLQPKATNSVATGSDPNPQKGNGISEIAGLIVATGSLVNTDNIHYFDTAWHAGTGLGSPGVVYRNLVRYTPPGGVLTLYAFSDSQRYAYSTNGTAWTVVNLNAGDANAKSLIDACVFDGKLVAVDSTGDLYMTIDPATITAWDKVTESGPVPDTPTRIVTFLNRQTLPAVYVVGTQGVWTIDIYSGETALILDLAGSKSAYNGLGACVHAGALHIPTARGVLRLDSNGVAANIGPNAPGEDGFPGLGLASATTTGYAAARVVMLQSDGLNLYALFSGHSSDLSGNTTAAILCYDGLGWHVLHVLRDSSLVEEQKNNMGTFYKSTTRALSGAYARFWVSTVRTRLSVTNAINYFDLPLGTENALLDTAYTYESSGKIVTPYDDCGFAEIPKGAYQLIVNYKLPASGLCSIAVEYQIDNLLTTSWTSLGTITDQTVITKTLYFGAASEGIAFQNIRFRFTLTRGATTTETPVLNYAVLKHIPRPPTRYSFSMELDLTHASIVSHGWRGYDEFRDWLEARRAAVPLLSFKEWSGAPTTYNVLVTSKKEDLWSEEISETRGRGGAVTLVLAEPV
jgi:hypothetical protein